MNTFLLSRNEAWTLSTLLHLPIQIGSLLSEWFALETIPSVEAIQQCLPTCIETLKSKGYYKENKALDNDLIQSLMLAAVGQKHIYTALHGENISAFARFLHAGNGAVQYGYTQEFITLHSPKQFPEVLPTLLPEWLIINDAKTTNVTMSFNTFLVFKESCLQRNTNFVLNSDNSEDFSISELTHSFARDNQWLDVFNAMGINSADALKDVSVQNQIDQLISLDYLEMSDSGRLKIGESGMQLAEVLSDPNLIAVTFSYSCAHPLKTVNSAFVIGKGELFRIDFLNEIVMILRIKSRKDAINWIKTIVQ
jgi:hypothetical protein